MNKYIVYEKRTCKCPKPSENMPSYYAHYCVKCDNKGHTMVEVPLEDALVDILSNNKTARRRIAAYTWTI